MAFVITGERPRTSGDADNKALREKIARLLFGEVPGDPREFDDPPPTNPIAARAPLAGFFVSEHSRPLLAGTILAGCVPSSVGPQSVHVQVGRRRLSLV